jgi:hypothetical protein
MESAGIHFSNDSTGYIVSGNVIVKVLRRSDDLSPLEYKQATYVLSTKNSVTMKELNEQFSLVSQEVADTPT